jgi:hypothetical protein
MVGVISVTSHAAGEHQHPFAAHWPLAQLLLQTLLCFMSKLSDFGKGVEKHQWSS